MTSHYVWTTIRYPKFLQILTSDFLIYSRRPKHLYIELGYRYLHINVSKTKNGETEQLKPTVEYPEGEEIYPIFHCGLPDGAYRVLDAFDKEGNSYFLNVVNGSYNSKEMALAGAYASWCRQSKNPTGETTMMENYDHETGSYKSQWVYKYHYGGKGECYDMHNYVRRSEFNVDKKTVLVTTDAQMRSRDL